MRYHILAQPAVGGSRGLSKIAVSLVSGVHNSSNILRFNGNGCYSFSYWLNDYITTPMLTELTTHSFNSLEKVFEYTDISDF